MPATLPSGWPAQSVSQVLPGVYVTLPSLGTLAVGSWQLERELQGALLPGNVRAASGITIGSGSVAVRGIEADGSIWSPWSQSHPVSPGGTASWFASYGGPTSAAKVSLGDWQISPQSGSLASPSSRSIELVERQYTGTTQPNAIQADAAGVFVDPVFVVDQLARQLGYYSTPKPPASCILSVPVAGGLYAEVGSLALAIMTSGSWSSTNGRVACTGTWSAQAAVAGPSSFGPASEVYVAVDVLGEVDLAFGDTSTMPVVTVNTTTQTIKARATGSAAIASGSFVAGGTAVLPNRVQLHIQRLGSSGAWTGARVRARSSATASWSAWVTSTDSSALDATSLMYVYSIGGATVSGFTVCTADEASIWSIGTARLEPLNGTISSQWVDGSLNAWTALQQVVAAWCGAAWVSADAVLTVRNRDSMAGLNQAARPIDVGAAVEDLPWSIDPSDTADRLVITYNPVDKAVQIEQPSTQAPIAWSASDAYTLPPGQTTVVVADVDGYFDPLGDILGGTGGSAWTPGWITSPRWSVYSVFPNRDGTGTHPADGVLVFQTRQVSTGRVEIRITNTSNQTLYTVDANGNPCLYLAAIDVYRQSNTATITRGADAATAANPLTIDLGKYVQNDADAESIADYIWGRVSTPAWKASSVRVALDWSHDIGDVVQLTHSRSGLNAKAIITKIAFDGAPGQVTQTLDFVLLPPTWADFDAAWSGKTWTNFDTVWSAKTWADFDYNPTRTA